MKKERPCRFYMCVKAQTNSWAPAWAGAIGIFLLGLAALIGLDQLAQHHYVKGEQLRGTRKLSPRKYEKEHRHDYGYGLTVYEMESTKKWSN